jgi:hypothetical protein
LLGIEMLSFCRVLGVDAQVRGLGGWTTAPSSAAMYSQFCVRLVQVVVDGADGHDEPVRDLFVGQTVCGELDDFPFPWGQGGGAQRGQRRRGRGVAPCGERGGAGGGPTRAVGTPDPLVGA